MLEFWLNRLLTKILTNVLAKVKPAYLEMLEISTFKLGDSPPKIMSSRCWKGNEGETILEWDLVLVRLGPFPIPKTVCPYKTDTFLLQSRKPKT